MILGWTQKFVIVSAAIKSLRSLSKEYIGIVESINYFNRNIALNSVTLVAHL